MKSITQDNLWLIELWIFFNGILVSKKLWRNHAVIVKVSEGVTFLELAYTELILFQQWEESCYCSSLQSGITRKDHLSVLLWILFCRSSTNVSTLVWHSNHLKKIAHCQPAVLISYAYCSTHCNERNIQLDEHQIMGLVPVLRRAGNDL